MNESTESARATAAGLAAAKDYADTVLKGPLAQLGGILSDTVGHWRLRNQVRLLLKTKQFMKDRGVQAGKVLPDIFVPIVEDGSAVEDERLSDMFASLLASHLDSKSSNPVHPSFTKVLAQLSPLDARLLERCRALVSDKEYRDLGLRGSPVSVEMAADWLSVPKDDAYLSCLNLRRLGLLRHFGADVPEGHPIPPIFEDDRDHQAFRLTEYGIAFCDACGCADPWGRSGSFKATGQPTA